MSKTIVCPECNGMGWVSDPGCALSRKCERCGGVGEVDLYPSAGGNKVSYEQRRGIYKAALRRWGAELQTLVAIEEMSELTKELCKIGRGTRDLEALADEIADVIIMLEQLRMIYGINEEVCQRMDYKILRLEMRLGTPEEDA